MNMSGTSWQVYASIAAGLVLAGTGAWLARLGLRPRRVGRTPHCPKCDYALIGLLPERRPAGDADGPPVRCPECGGRVTWRTAMIGDRPPRKGRGWVGVAVLLLGLATVAAVGMGVTPRVQWIRWKPASWLVSDLRSADTGARDAALTEIGRRLADKSFPNSLMTDLDAASVDALAVDSAMDGKVGDYLQGRFGRLAPDTRRTLLDLWIKRLGDRSFVVGSTARDRLVALVEADALGPDDHARLTAAALARQLGALTAGAAFDDFWFNYLGDREARRLLSDADRTAFFRRALATTLAVRPVVVEGDPLYYETRYAGAGPHDGWSSTRKLERLEVDGRLAEEGTWSSMSSGFGAGTGGSSTPSPGPGKHVLTVVLGRSAIYDKDPSTGGTAKRAPRFSERITLTAPFEVLPRGSPSPLKWVDDPALGEQLRRAIQPDEVRLTRQGRRPLSLELNLKKLPVGVSFRVIVRVGGTEYPLQTIGAAKGRSTTWLIGAGEIESGRPPAGTAKCDLLLRSDPRGALNTVDLFEAWRGELVYPGVPVKSEH